MRNNYLKSYAKINLALNVTGKRNSMHKIESIISFIDLHDLISIQNIKSNNHKISFYGKFSKNIKRFPFKMASSKNTLPKHVRRPYKLPRRIHVPLPAPFRIFRFQEDLFMRCCDS